MDYKKKYKGALEWARKVMQGKVGFVLDEVLEKFPELKESEDERIRKELIEHIKDQQSSFISAPDCRDKYEDEENQKYNSWIAWLEKQGDKDKLIKELGEYKVKYTQEVLSQQLEKQGEQKSVDKAEPKFKIEKGKWYVCIKDLLDNYANKAFCKGDTYLSTQDGSLIPSNSNVPFEVICAGTYFRDWTIQDTKAGDVLSWDDSKCIAIFKNIYDEDSFNSYGFVGGCTGTFESRQSYHDIEGAHPATKKQRDTLMKAMTNAGYTFDFEKRELKKIEQKPVLDFKANDWYVSKVDGKIHNIYYPIDKVKPKFKVGDTIKCKCDDRQFTIKSVVLDKGPYTYTQEGCGNDIDYADKNFELVEQKPVDSLIEEEKPLLEKFKQAVYDCAWGKVTCKKEGETKEEYANRWAEHFLLMVRDWADDYIDFTIQQKLRNSYEKGKADIIEQKPATMSLDEAIEHCEEKSCGNNACALEHKQLKNWLTELKELKEQKSAWSEEDEEMLEDVRDNFEFNKGEMTDALIAQYDRFFDKIKYLQPQSKQEWSEEDENHVKSILSTIECCKTQFPNTPAVVEVYNTDIAWLKSLKERYTWKPSEEQLHYLSWIANIKLGDSVVEQEVSKHLNELYEDLLKLKG